MYKDKDGKEFESPVEGLNPQAFFPEANVKMESFSLNENEKITSLYATYTRSSLRNIKFMTTWSKIGSLGHENYDERCQTVKKELPPRANLVSLAGGFAFKRELAQLEYLELVMSVAQDMN